MAECGVPQHIQSHITQQRTNSTPPSPHYYYYYLRFDDSSHSQYEYLVVRIPCVGAGYWFGIAACSPRRPSLQMQKILLPSTGNKTCSQLCPAMHSPNPPASALSTVSFDLSILDQVVVNSSARAKDWASNPF